jgi:pimeloyl-ACP methyl ester carboxylesterase
VNPAIETREVISVTVGGNSLWGTYHKSHSARRSSSASSGEANRVGVLFLNPGFLPRASPSAVYWANCFAKCGYPAFRFDLPGLGDSEGDLPDKMLDFVSAGGYASSLSAIIKQLAERFSLSGVVIMGLCAGAVTALFTAAITKECSGVVLMDPYFNVPPDRLKIQNELSQWATWTRLGALASEIYHRFRYVALLLSGNKLPRNANFPLLRCWKQLTSAGTPILVLKAPAVKSQGLKPRAGVFDYLAYLQASSGRRSRVEVHFLEGTNHSFADHEGCRAVRHHTVQWLKDCFPPVTSSKIAVLKKPALQHAETGLNSYAPADRLALHRH